MMLNRLCFLSFLILLLSAPVFAQSDALSNAYREAQEKIRPWVVRIETIGGREVVEGELVNNGATSGLLLDGDGYIISSAFNFLHDPSSILIMFPDGSKKVAALIATDRSRMITLLKVESLESEMLKNAKSDDGFAPPHVLQKDVKVGQWAIAVGSSLSNEEPNISVGIVSGKGRIWGKAIQTDAAVSPNNYGGPLVNLKGEVMGILAPLSMMSDDVTGGADLYDGGVGMAVTTDDIIVALPRLKQKKNLLPGDQGFIFKMNTLFTDLPIVEDVASGSPATDAGLKKGDRILKVNGETVETALRAQTLIKRLYADDELELTVKTGNEPEKTLKWQLPAPKKQPNR